MVCNMSLKNDLILHLPKHANILSDIYSYFSSDMTNMSLSHLKPSNITERDILRKQDFPHSFSTKPSSFLKLAWKGSCDRLFFSIVMYIQLKRLLEQEKNTGWDFIFIFKILLLTLWKMLNHHINSHKQHCYCLLKLNWSGNKAEIYKIQ